MDAWDNFTRDLTKHRGRAALLAALFVTLVAMGIRAALQMRPRSTAAFPVLPAPPNNPIANTFELGGAQAAARIQQSQALWRALREVKPAAADPQAAFTFDASYYPPPIIPVEVSRPVVVGPEIAPAPAPVVDDSAARTGRIREQARALVVKSTAVGNGASAPMAIVNQQLLTVGQIILGFEITAIRAREVEFVKDGVTTVVKMPDGQ